MRQFENEYQTASNDCTQFGTVSRIFFLEFMQNDPFFGDYFVFWNSFELTSYCYFWYNNMALLIFVYLSENCSSRSFEDTINLGQISSLTFPCEFLKVHLLKSLPTVENWHKPFDFDFWWKSFPKLSILGMHRGRLRFHLNSAPTKFVQVWM